MDKKEHLSCSHCHLTFDESVMIKQTIDEEVHYFCCKGCQGVFNLLHDQGLDRFYDQSKDVKLTPQSKTLQPTDMFDSDSFLQQFAKPKGELLEIALVVEGIHCSACVWLNEKVLSQTDGIVEASINFSTNKAKVVWDPSEIKLSQIVEVIRAIGYDAYAYDPNVSEDKAAKVKKEYFSRLIVAVFATMNIMWIALAQYAGYFTGIEQDMKTILNVAEWVLATPVLFYSGWVFFRGAYFGLKNSYVNMDITVATGALLTYIYSIYITLTQDGEAYFDSVSMIITFVLLGKFFEVLSKNAASDTLDKMNKHIPLEVRRITHDNKVEMVSLHSVQKGDVLEVHAGERFAVDGVIVKGQSYIDESTITGESQPLFKQEGEMVLSGTFNVNNIVKINVTAPYATSTFAKLIELLEHSLSKKPSIEQIANQISGYFSAVIVGLSVVAFLLWYIGFHASFDTAFMIGISVIIIACPCALALATPIATLVGVSLGAKRGVLFKEARFLESLAKVKTVFIDKTGTLTQGKPEVFDTQTLHALEDTIIATMTSKSIHPISKAVYGLYKEHETVAYESITMHAALGLHMQIKDQNYYGGSLEYMKMLQFDIPTILHDSSHFFVANSKGICKVFYLKDAIREGAKEFIEYLKAKNIEVVMLTGDTKEVAQEVAQTVGIPTVHALLKPEDKAHYVKECRADHEGVVMIGDGVNDTVALAQADVAISMGKGADVAVDTSDVVLLYDDMKSLKESFVIAHRTYKLIKQNLGLSLVYNVITIPLAMAGFIIPLIAALSMSLSSLLVVGNSLRIKYLKG